MLDILDLEGRREPGTPHPACQGGWDLVWDGSGPVTQYEQPTSLCCLLGAFNPHDANQARQALTVEGGEGGGGGVHRPARRTVGSSSSSGGSGGGAAAGSSTSGAGEQRAVPS
jgi:hypothetical protein